MGARGTVVQWGPWVGWGNPGRRPGIGVDSAMELAQPTLWAFLAPFRL